MIRVTVDSIRVSLLTQQRIVLLRDSDNRRYLPIYIDPFLAEAIARSMQGEAPPRPMTHDLLKNIISELGGSVEHVLISQLQEGTYYALLSINTRNGRREIDARSSDAIALALRADVPIYVAEAVLDQGGQAMDEEEETEEEETPLLPAPRGSERTETERRPTTTAREETEERDVNEESLSVFRDFINSLEKPKPPEESS
ncbi:MAG: bifunctional nuclease family protein [Herpetosiphonaceae bacterium]|nr:bifunctional nuclease family protein [Herpetosiphonaceae bacterium]